MNAGSHGTEIHESQEIPLASPDHAEPTPREELTDGRRQGTLMVRIFGSAGSGKTSLLEATVRSLAAEARVAVMLGQNATERDIKKIEAHAAVALVTSSGLFPMDRDAVERAVHELGPVPWDYLFLEDCANLTVTSWSSLGEHLRVMVLSTTQGDDKPVKFPKAFEEIHALVVSKADLLPHVQFSLDSVISEARQAHPDLTTFAISIPRNSGLEPWLVFLRDAHHELSLSQTPQARSASE